MLNEPTTTEVLSPNSFFYIYEYKKQKDVDDLIQKRIPRAEKTIKTFFRVMIQISTRAHALKKKAAWTAEKTKNWILRTLKKKGVDEKSIADFEKMVDGETPTDNEEMRKFLERELFSVEVLARDDWRGGEKE